jgi:hypothetical protein
LGREALVICEKLLVRWQFEIRRQRVEPIFGPINLLEGLHALTTPRQAVSIIIGVLAIGESPLAQVARALGEARFGLALGKCRKQQTRENGDDRDDYKEFEQSETEARA